LFNKNGIILVPGWQLADIGRHSEEKLAAGFGLRLHRLEACATNTLPWRRVVLNSAHFYEFLEILRWEVLKNIEGVLERIYEYL